jgi:protein O-GlcNAc transferase
MNIDKALKAAFDYYRNADWGLAADVCKKILAKKPNNSDALHLMGLISYELGDNDSAMKYMRRALLYEPTRADLYTNLATVIKKTGNLDEATGYYQKALQFNPLYAEAHCNLGVAFQEAGRYEEAMTCYRKALEINPDYADAYYNLATALRNSGRYEEAVTYYQKTLQLNPAHAEAYNNLGVCLQEQGRYEEAMACYQKALQLRPALADSSCNLGTVFREQGKLNEALICYKHALQINANLSSCYSNLLLAMNYNSSFDARTIFAEHLRFAEQYEKPLYASVNSHANDRSHSRRLRVGYVSPDFRKHSVGYFIEPVLTFHDREQVEVFCYSDVLLPDEFTHRIAGHTDRWQSIAGTPDQEVAEFVRRDGIDILVDLAGHTAGNRMLLFARKPAPVQVTWIGYPATTGLSTMDYKVVDNYTDPRGMTEQFYTEELVRMPESFLCYLPDRDSPEVKGLPALSAGRVTFGSFNHFAKITPEVLRIWNEILRAVPDSRLILKAKSFSDRMIRNYAIKCLTDKGIPPEKSELLPPEPSTGGHLETYNRIDIGLDTFPYNGTTTTCEALWMGVPVITLAGDIHSSRVGTSLLSNVGLPELVATTHAGYIEKAVNLASDMERLRLLRERLRDEVASSPLMAARRFAQNLEICYRKMWERYCDSV